MRNKEKRNNYLEKIWKDNTIFKKCKQCGVEKLLSEFNIDRTSKFGKNTKCKECCKIKKPLDILPEGFKRCFSCKDVLGFENFIKDAQKPDGHRPNCKKCNWIKKHKKLNIPPPPFIPKPKLDFDEKYCPKCKNIKKLKSFDKDITTKSGYCSMCRKCKNKYKLDNAISGVYKITNPNGKIYIGASNNIKNRWSSYKSEHGGKLIKESIETYELKNHKFEIIEECDVEDLNCRERYWQDYYDVLGENGLNRILEACGDKPQIMSEELKNEIRKGVIRYNIKLNSK